jgi:formyltetrahydrofolate-dependent phosphoribosylglycinamide formyltransferase
MVMAKEQVGGRVATLASPLRCAVFISGSGTGLEALLRYQQHGCNHITCVVISNKSEVQGLKYAEQFGIPSVVVPHQDEQGHRLSREVHEQLIIDQLQKYDVELIVLSGYMLLLSPHLIAHYGPHIVNIHPSLLPKFPGAHAHRDVIEAKETMSGCTVHLVDEGMDSGQILGQMRVPVFADDTESSLSQRVKIEEHRLYPSIISKIANGEIHVEGHE